MSINETSKIALRKGLSFKVRNIIYTPTLNGFKRSDGIEINFMDMFMFSLMNPDLKATLIGNANG